jgi:O-antigen ligase
MMNLKQIANNWRLPDYGIILLILIFAVWNKAMPAVMVLCALTLIAVRNDTKEIKKLFSIRYPFVWFVLFFLAHVSGMLNTTNTEFGVADIGMKASLIAVPIFLVSTKLRLKTKHIVNTYLIALLIAVLVCYSYAVFRSIDAPEDNHFGYFTESYFSFLMHRSYFATYLALGALISIVRFFDDAKWRNYYFLLSVVFLVSTVLTFSKAGILILLVLIVPIGYYLIAKQYKRGYAVLTVLFFIFAFAVGIGSSDRLSSRFELMVNGFVNHQSTSNTSFESSASRMIMWTTSLQLFSEHPFVGVGTGDVRDALDQRNEELGNLGVVEHSLNSHNQYLNTGVQLGLVGLLPMFFAFLTSFAIAIRKRNLILFITTSTFVLTMLFESFLETQAGLIPVTLFLLLLSLKVLEKDKEHIQT